MKDRVLRGFSCFGVVSVFVASLLLIGCSKKIAPIGGASGLAPDRPSESLTGRSPAELGTERGSKNSIGEERVPSDEGLPFFGESAPGGDGAGEDPFILADGDSSSGLRSSPGGDEGTGLLQDAYFEFDQWVLPHDAQSTLEHNARWLEVHPEARIQIEGHCDVRGTNEYNLALGERRAKSAMNFLVSMGVDRSRISFISFGEEKNNCSEKSEACYRKNRRAHFVVLEK